MSVPISNFTAEMWDFTMKMRALFSYDIPADRNAPFLKFHDWLTNPQPRLITDWRAANSHWCHRLVDGVGHHARETYAAALYHGGNLLTLERAAIETAKAARSVVPPNGVMAVGTEKLNFEYQALELAYDRFFEHFTRALNAFFKDKSHNFVEFGRLMRRRKNHPVAIALAEVYEAFRPRFSHTFSQSNDKSLRSRIMHHESVAAGCLNIKSNGQVFFAGGGDNLIAPHRPGGKRLSDVIGERLTLMHEYTTAIMDAFVPAARAWDAARS